MQMGRGLLATVGQTFMNVPIGMLNECMVFVRNYRALFIRTDMLVIERRQKRGRKKEKKEEAYEFIFLKELAQPHIIILTYISC